MIIVADHVASHCTMGGKVEVWSRGAVLHMMSQGQQIEKLCLAWHRY